MAMISRGDVVLCNLGPPSGTEQAGVRPAVILQTDHLNAASPHTIVVPFTSKIRQALLKCHVQIPAGIGGLTQESVALCEQIRALDVRKVIKKLGHLDGPYLDAIAVALRATLDL
jgi:mRNA interferase MazF